ncbi:aminoglycoside phosphotransferase family protein [bacterium]|nr:aminoglycoside phosphotransferase family protein [bacterium]
MQGKDQKLPKVLETQFEPIAEDELHKFVSKSLRYSHHRASIESIERRILKRRMDWRGARLFERLKVRLSNGMSLYLFLKCFRPHFDSGPSSPNTGSDREADVYRILLKGTTLGTAQYYGIHNINRYGEVLLLLEFVQGKKLNKIKDQKTWLAVAKWLAHIHHHFSKRLNDLYQIKSLYRHDSTFFWNWAYLAAESASSVSPKVRKIMARILMQYEKVAAPLSNAPSTLLHGEFYCTNIFIRHEEQRRFICAFDWETAAIGCAALDLTHLLRQRFGISSVSLVDSYLEGWNELGGAPFSSTQLWQYIRRFKVHELMYFIWSDVNHKRTSAERILIYAKRAEQYMDSF